METSKDVMRSNRSLEFTRHNRVRTFFLTLSCLPVLLAGCAQLPTEDFATNCEAYGVIENNTPMGTIAHLEPLFRNELKVLCAGVPAATAANHAEIAGCVIPHENGVVEAYYWSGDQCAMNHELCHFRHGPRHTDRYLRELQEGIPMPYCPKNQLRM